MKRKKIFIGINLPDYAKKALVKKTIVWRDLPIKWVPAENMHITLVFLGYVDNEKIGEICLNLKEAVKNINAFEVELKTINLGPDEEKPNLLWLEGDSNENLKTLEKAVNVGLGSFVVERKDFRPHVTLGRLRAEKWKNLEKKPQIEKTFLLSVPVDSVDIFESGNNRKEFLLLEKIELS